MKYWYTESHHLAAYLALSSSVAFGCATGRAPRVATMPFHLAVIPPEIVSEESATGNLEGKDTELLLDLEETEISQGLREALGKAGFTRVSLLAYPSGISAAEFSSWERDRQDEHWVGSAGEVQADLLLDGTLRYQPAVRTARNDKFALNFVLFSLGGPATWWVNDRAYSVDVRFKGSLHDVAPLLDEERGATLDNNRARVVDMGRELEEVNLDFRDRAGGSLGRYALSLVWPAGLLSVETEAAKEAIEAEIVAGISRSFADELQDRREELIRAGQLVDFQPEDLKVIWGPNGLGLQGAVVLQAEEQDRLGSLSYRVGSGQFIEASFGRVSQDATEGRRGPLKRFEVDVALMNLTEPDPEFVQVEVRDSTRDENVRTFTYPVLGASAYREPRSGPQ